jgi:tetratricopeptide (TPR) repeat protein
MRWSHFSPKKCVQVSVFLIFFSVSVFAQMTPVQSTGTPTQTKGPINLDRDLEEPVAADRAVSYYHYALAKWYEDEGNDVKALSEMRIALKYNKDSIAVHLEMAALLQKTGNIDKALEYAQEAARLDPQDPDPHWFLANIYFRPRGRADASAESLKNAVQELEKLKELTPEDERVYYYLGGAYFELNEPEKAIEAYEKFQTFSPGSDQGYREIAQYYNRSGDSEEAIEYLRKGLEIQPNSPESLWMLGQIYSNLGNYKEAISAFKKLLETTSHKIPVGNELADLLFKTGEYNETIDVLNNLIKAEPSNRTARILLGRAQIGLRRISEAIQTFQSLVEMDPDDLEAQFYLGTAYEQGDKYEDAINIFSSLLDKVNAKNEGALANRFIFQQHLAASYIELGEYEKAIALYQEMISADSGETEENRSVLRQQLAYAFIQLGEYERAIALYQEMAKVDARLNPQLLNAYRISRQFEYALPFGKELHDKDPGNIQIGLYYAQTLADAGKIEEGVEILSELLASNPQEIDLYIALSQVYVQGKRYADAEAILRRAEEEKLDNEHGEVLKFQLATIYERKQDFDLAENIFKDILKINPQNASVLNYIGYMLADRGVRLEEALQYVKKALTIDPNNGAYLDSLGWAFFKLNDMENAEKYLLEADKLVRNDPVIDEHLGDLYFETGDLQKAQDFWVKSVSIGTDPDDVQKVRQKLQRLQETLRKQKSEK